MTAVRACGLIAVMAALALSVVLLRTAQVRSAARILASESQWLELRRELWQVQAGVARLKTPARLYDRLQVFQAQCGRPPELAVREAGKSGGNAWHGRSEFGRVASVPKD